MKLQAQTTIFWQMLVVAAVTTLLPLAWARALTCSPTCTDTQCTTSVCDENSGQCVSTSKSDGTPCLETDSNACTTAGCEMGQCVQTHISTACPTDANECTLDLACNPATGLCDHPFKIDGAPCDDTDNIACTIAGCEMGQCVQTHLLDHCPPTATATATATATLTATSSATPTNTPVPNGGECSAAGQCQSGNCVDAVCCDTPCERPFEHCNLPGQAGTCGSTAAGVPATSSRGLMVAALLLAGVAALAIARRRRRT